MKSGNKLIFLSLSFFSPPGEKKDHLSFPFFFCFCSSLVFFSSLSTSPHYRTPPPPLRPADDAVQRGHQRRLVQRLGLRRLTRGQNGKKRARASPKARRAGGCLRFLLLTGSFGHVLAFWVTRAERQIKFGFDSPSLQITIL